MRRVRRKPELMGLGDTTPWMLADLLQSHPTQAQSCTIIVWFQMS